MSKGLSPSQTKIVRLSGNHRVIATHPYLNKIYGIAKGTCYYQILYWNGKQADKSGWIRKTKNQLFDETGVTEDQQDGAIKLGVSEGFLQTLNRGIPCTRHIRIDVDKFIEVTAVRAESMGLVVAKDLIQFPEKQLTITKSTQNITAINKPEANSIGGILERHPLRRKTDKGV